MNDLVERTIDFLEKQSLAQGLLYLSEGGGNLQTLPAVSDTVFVGSVFFMEKFARLVQKDIISRSLEGGKLFINFQSFAKVARRAASLLEVDKLQNEVYVYGADEVTEWPFSRFKRVTLTRGDRLLGSWFIIYWKGDSAYSLVAVEEEAPAGSERTPIPNRGRFRGFWTTRPSVAHYLADYLLRVVNAQYSTEPPK
jgi:hypothetical protein